MMYEYATQTVEVHSTGKMIVPSGQEIFCHKKKSWLLIYEVSVYIRAFFIFYYLFDFIFQNFLCIIC